MNSTTKALELYWSQIKTATKSNWKYLFAFGLGSIASNVFSFLFTKSITGWSTSQLIMNIFWQSGLRKYRNIINYTGFSVNPSSIRPSPENMAMDAFFRASKAKSKVKVGPTTTIKQFRNVYLTLRKQDLEIIQSGFVRLSPFVPSPEEIMIKPSSYNNTGSVKGHTITYPGAKLENGMVYYIHGGGWFSGLSNIYIYTYTNTITLSIYKPGVYTYAYTYRYPQHGFKMLEIMSKYLGMKTLAIEYHHCPEISLPQQVDECIDGYKYILNTLKVDQKKYLFVVNQLEVI